MKNYYQAVYSQYIGPIDLAIKAICKNYTYSELYEIAALCSVLQCNIRTVCPKIDFRQHMSILDNVFAPIPPITSNCKITILWSNASKEKDARETNNGVWSPNHFVPLISPGIHNDSSNASQSTSLAAVSHSFANECSKL